MYARNGSLGVLKVYIQPVVKEGMERTPIFFQSTLVQTRVTFERIAGIINRGTFQQ
jgi:hypothetical protein